MQKEKYNLTSGATLRALLIATILIPINCYWVIEMEVIRYSGHPVTISLFFNVVFSVLVLITLNFGIKKFLPNFALTQSELLVVYVMVSLASGIAGHDMLEILVPMLGHPFRFATVENEWTEIFYPYLPRWLMVSDDRILRGYYEGGISLYTREQLWGWASPVLWWTAFIFALVFGMLCINVIVRKRWTEQEKLSYPIIQLPLEMTNTANMQFFKNRVLWIGFGIAAGLTILNGIHFLYPTVPEMRTRVRNFGYLLTEKPWNALGGLPVSFYPFAIGLGFFIPLDLSFSCWFFYWYWKFLRMIGSMLGLRSLPGFPYMSEQASGGYIALCLIALWASRRHLGKVMRKVIGRRTDLDDADEPMRYRTAFIGLVASIGFILFFCYRGGASVSVILVFFLLYYAISIAITRMRAELGTIVHDLHYSGPDEILTRTLGTRRIERGTLAMFSLFWFINRAYRSHPMPHQLEGFKLAERTRTSNKGLIFAIMFAVGFGSLAAFWALIDRGYRLGMELKAPWPSLTAFGIEPWRRMEAWVNAPTGTDVVDTVSMGIGVVMTFILMLLRMKFVWWPLHPAGFAISTSWGMNVTWSCLFVSWLLKWIILRFGGLGAHRKATPFFLGLILGEFTMGSLWTIIGIVLGIPTYGFWV